MADIEDPYGFRKLDHPHFDAEVSKSSQPDFEHHYYLATGQRIRPNITADYFSIDNKWGAELRIYFNAREVAIAFRKEGVHVEEWPPFRSEYRYRINLSRVWWDLVERWGFRIGIN